MTSSTRHAGPASATPTAELSTPESSTAGLSTGELMTRLSTQVSNLVRGELELARTELATKGKRAGIGAGLAGAGGVVALFGVGALVAAAIAALALVLPVWLAAVIVGALLILVAVILALAGRASIKKAIPPLPSAAVDSVQDDVATVKQAVRR